MPHSSCVLFRITSNDLAIYSVTRSIARSFCDGWVTMMMMMMMMMLMLLLLLQISRSRQCCPTSCEWRTEPRSSSRRRWWRWHRRHRTWSVSVTKYRQRKTASSRLIPRSSICIMNLPALRITPFLHGNGLARWLAMRTSPCWHRNGFAARPTYTGLRPAQLALRASQCWRGTDTGANPEKVQGSGPPFSMV